MGLENTGFALANDTLIWIDPVDYQDDLEAAVDALRAECPYQFTTCRAACFQGRFGPTPFNLFPTGRMAMPMNAIAVWSGLAVRVLYLGTAEKKRGISPILVACDSETASRVT